MLRSPFSKSGTLFVPSQKVSDVADKLEKKIGCRVTGTFYMHFLANHFHVTYGNPPLLAQVSRALKKRRQDFLLDLSHKIHHVSFGASHNHAKSVQK